MRSPLSDEVSTMNNIKFIKIAGLLSAVLSGVVALLSGDYVTGAGVIAAAFSSVSVFSSEAA